jgi:hypothetical protein
MAAMTSPFTLPPTARHAFDRLAGDLARVLGRRLVAVVATSAAESVVFADALSAGDLDALGELVAQWHREGLDTPLVVTPDEFRRSLDAFPLEYQTIVDRHVVIAGEPPFHDVVVPADHLRRACEVQAKAHLIHLRQGWLEAAGHEDELAALIARSAAPLRALLANVARLHDPGAGADLNGALAGARLAGLPEPVMRGVLELDEAPERRRGLVRDLPAYLAASERLWAFVDGWRRSP